MNIGIDIDNVISKFNEGLLNAFLNEDKKLRNNGIINKNADITCGMFDWTGEEVNNFYTNNIQKIAENLEVKEDAKKYIDKLKKDGCNIYIITGRDNGEYKDPYTMTKTWLKKHDIYYDKLILTNAYDYLEKAKVCLENAIDIMIDDSTRICKGCIENNITTLLMDTPYNKKLDITRVYNWKEIYDYIKNYKKEKII